eukprot:13642568-Ditylum_brightwellii.AAC.1
MSLDDKVNQWTHCMKSSEMTYILDYTKLTHPVSKLPTVHNVDGNDWVCLIFTLSYPLVIKATDSINGTILDEDLIRIGQYCNILQGLLHRKEPKYSNGSTPKKAEYKIDPIDLEAYDASNSKTVLQIHKSSTKEYEATNIPVQQSVGSIEYTVYV